MKKLIYTLFILLLISSCTDEELISPQENIKEATTRAVGDGKWDALGYGYNCLYSDFKDPVYTKARVIDLDRLQTGRGRDQITKQEVVFNPSEIIEALLHGRTESQMTYGSSIEKFAENITINAQADFSLGKVKLFTMHLETTIKSSSSTYDENAFYRVDALKTTRRLTLPYTNPSRLKYFLTDEFLADLTHIAAKFISCNKYCKTSI